MSVTNDPPGCDTRTLGWPLTDWFTVIDPTYNQQWPMVINMTYKHTVTYSHRPNLQTVTHVINMTYKNVVTYSHWPNLQTNSEPRSVTWPTNMWWPTLLQSSTRPTNKQWTTVSDMTYKHMVTNSHRPDLQTVNLQSLTWPTNKLNQHQTTLNTESCFDTRTVQLSVNCDVQ